MFDTLPVKPDKSSSSVSSGDSYVTVLCVCDIDIDINLKESVTMEEGLYNLLGEQEIATPLTDVCGEYEEALLIEMFMDLTSPSLNKFLTWQAAINQITFFDSDEDGDSDYNPAKDQSGSSDDDDDFGFTRVLVKKKRVDMASTSNSLDKSSPAPDCTTPAPGQMESKPPAPEPKDSIYANIVDATGAKQAKFPPLRNSDYEDDKIVDEDEPGIYIKKFQAKLFSSTGGTKHSLRPYDKVHACKYCGFLASNLQDHLDR